MSKRQSLDEDTLSQRLRSQASKGDSKEPARTAARIAPEPAPASKNLQPGKLRDPQGFIDSVAGFVNRLDSDLETLAHFADGLAKKREAPPEARNGMSVLRRDIDALSKAIGTPLSQLGRDMRKVGDSLHASQSVGPRDARPAAKRAADTSAWGKAKRMWFPRG